MVHILQIQCSSSASTVTTDSTATTSASETLSIQTSKGKSSPAPSQREERKPVHYVNVLPHPFKDPVHSSINGVGLPPPRPKSTKPQSHVAMPPLTRGTPMGSLGRRSVTPSAVRTNAKNGVRNGSNGATSVHGLPSPVSSRCPENGVISPKASTPQVSFRGLRISLVAGLLSSFFVKMFPRLPSF